MIPKKVHPNNARLATVPNCPVPSCGESLINVFFLCRACWFLADGRDRGDLYRMQQNGQDVTTKLEKMVRDVSKKRECVRAKSVAIG